MNCIITIGREFGSGGRELGRRLSEKLRIAYYDQEIVSEIARRTELSERYVQQITSRRPITSYPITVGHSFRAVPAPIPDQGYTVYQEQCSILREMAGKSDCVIVGRCADCILRDWNPFRIFVYADMDSKLARCRRKGEASEEMTDRELRQRIQSVNRNRARYYSFYTGQKWGDRIHYDLCINTTNSSVKKVAAAVARLFDAGEGGGA